MLPCGVNGTYLRVTHVHVKVPVSDRGIWAVMLVSKGHGRPTTSEAFALHATGGGLWAHNVLSLNLCIHHVWRKLFWKHSNAPRVYLLHGWGRRFSVLICPAGWVGPGLGKTHLLLQPTAAPEQGKDRQGLSLYLSPRISENRKWSWLVCRLPSAHKVEAINSPKLCAVSYQRCSVVYLPEHYQKLFIWKTHQYLELSCQGHTFYWNDMIETQ